ncbi:MAG: multicopper oxidase domain-containing protein [Haloarculaceae archaeon]
MDLSEQIRRRTFVQGVGLLPISTSLLDDHQVRERLQLSRGTTDGEVRTFTVHAVEVDVVMNRFDLHVPNGAMYVLEEDLDAVREASGEPLEDAYASVEDGNRKDPSPIQPLVIRANEGDTIEIEFVNDLDQRASIHQTGLPYNVRTSDGMAVGYNNDTTVAPGESRTYRWEATHQGAHFFYDGAHQAIDSATEPPEEANHLSRGLFGAVVVEPPGATWTDPQTGEPLRSGLRADVHDPNGLGTSYREFVAMYHTPEGTAPEVTWPDSDTEQSIHAINYRSDPMGQRVNDELPDAGLKEAFYHSWTNGDPGGGDNIYEAYSGDPVKLVFVGASHEENHVHHLHNHRYKQAARTDADTVDAQTIGLGDAFESFLVAGHGEGTVRPGMSFEEAFEVGAGYVHGGAGDVLFHCHLFPHYAEGMWAGMRVFDKERESLRPLPNTSGLIPADSSTPGYPEFVGDAIEAVEGVEDPVGYYAPQPPELSRTDPREPTEQEREALGDDVRPGAPYADPIPEDPNRTVEYTIAVMEASIAYNDAGEHDPDGIVYVLEEANVPGVTDGTVTVQDAERVRNGEMNPEPLFIRANVGDEVVLHLKNELDVGASIHPHFVGYDVLGSDSLGMGYNYRQGTDPAETNEYRWYADETGAIFFHDHIFAIEEGMHGMFCGIFVEPQGSEWRDPHSGDPIFSGAQADVLTPEDANEEDFRELGLHYHGFVPLRDRDGELINTDREHNVNLGTFAVNYRNAPYYDRNDTDSAYVHSSAVHGDPPTPVLEAYEGDPLKIRVLQGAYEDSHNFALDGLRIDPEGFAPSDSVSQIIGPSEAFTFDVEPEATQLPFEAMSNPDGLPVRDYRYGSNVVDDLFTGMWGLVRVWGGEVEHLRPLDDHGSPSETVRNEDLERMGHPAPFAEFDWTEAGQRARRLYAGDDDRLVPADESARRNPNVGEPPGPPDGPGEPSPDDAPIREFDVTAFRTEIPYNDHGDHDPHGIVFAPDRYVEEIREGTRDPEPLTLRANAGERIRINLTNDLPATLDDGHDHPLMRIDREWDRSTRISLHPNQIRYDVNGADGAAVGFNHDTTVGRGDTVTYEWYADIELGTVVLNDWADVRNNRHHGAYGQLIVQQRDAITLENGTAEASGTAAAAMVKTPGGEEDFRAEALVFADAQYIVNEADPSKCVVPPGNEMDPEAPCNQLGNDESQGYGAVNYRSAPFARRFETDDRQHLVYSSRVHGDPATPNLRTDPGDPVVFRVAHAADKARGVSFHLAGHQWQRYQGVPESPVIGVDGQYSPGKCDAFELIGGAGGSTETPGDYVYQETKQRRRLESGMWGILRVGNAHVEGNDGERSTHPLPDRADDVPLAARPGYVVQAADLTGNDTVDVVVGVPDSDIGAHEGGGVYVFLDTPPGRVRDLSEADLQVLSETAGERAGTDLRLTEEADDGSRDVLVERANDEAVRIEGGQTLFDLVSSPPDSGLDEFVRNTTNTHVEAIVPLELASE